MTIRDKVLKLGFSPLIEDGRFWRTKASFRGGTNPSSLSIRKSDGAWFDFGTGKCGSLKDLASLILGEANISEFESEDFDLEDFSEEESAYLGKPAIKASASWKMSELETLVPHYKFYTEKGITLDTLRFLKGGMKHGGPMNGRFVFPIFDEGGQSIIGWSGRDMTSRWQEKGMKWKHMGKKGDWVYPAYFKKGGVKVVEEAIKEAGFVILVESIGDFMALWEVGVKNVIVTFGLKVSKAIMKFFISCGVKKVVIAFNNDLESESNNGLLGAQQAFIKLMEFFDAGSLFVRLPKKNDFGEMDDIEIAEWKEGLFSEENRKAEFEGMLGFLRKKYEEVDSDGNRKITKKEFEHAKTIKDHIEAAS